MDEDKIKMLGEGPYPLPMDKFTRTVDICMDTDICIISPLKSIDFKSTDFHTHNSYEFTIPYSPMPYVDIEGKHYSIEKNHIFPINSQQYHGPYNSMFNLHFISINIDNNFLNEIAYSIFGKFNVFFKHGNYYFGSILQALIRAFIHEYKDIQPDRRLILKSLSTQITVELLRIFSSNMPYLITSDYNTSKKNINRSIEYLRTQYDKKYSLDEVSKLAHLSPYHFIRVFKSYTGQTPCEYLMNIKIEKAKEFLSSYNLNVTEICFICGFNNPSNFSTFFKRKVGVTPSQYRKILMSK